MNVKKADRLYRSDRLNYIINRMRVSHDITPTKLAEELNVSERTIYRDMRNLENCNSIQKRYSRREGRYLLEGELNLPPIALTPSEALALYTAACNLALDDDNYLSTDLRSGLSKIARILTPVADATTSELSESSEEPELPKSPTASTASKSAIERAARIDESDLNIDADELDELDEEADDEIDSDLTDSGWETAFITAESIYRPVMEVMRGAIRTQHKIQLLYSASHVEKAQYLIVSPYDLREVDGNWYLLAHSENLGGTHLFKMDRVRRVETLTERFRYPRRYTPDLLFHKAWELYVSNTAEITVKLLFAPEVAALVYHTQRHQFQKMQTEGDGSLICTTDIGRISEMRWWILSFGNQVEVLSPPDLRAEFARTFAEASAKHHSSLP